MTHDPASSPLADPFVAVADAMQSAADSMTHGAAAARDAAVEAMPSVGQFANRFIYSTCYTLSYGVVFPLALVAALGAAEQPPRPRPHGWFAGCSQQSR